MNDFYKHAKERGLIYPLHQAFIDNPVEEEDHQGNSDYFIKEKRIIYSKYQIGDIVFVKNYYYEDGTRGDKHLFVIIDENNIMAEMEYVGMLLSSKIHKQKYSQNILIEKNSQNNLNKDSIVKTDKLYQIFESNIEFKVGEITKAQLVLFKEIYEEYTNE
jgi:hypothetical protein